MNPIPKSWPWFWMFAFQKHSTSHKPPLLGSIYDVLSLNISIYRWCWCANAFRQNIRPCYVQLWTTRAIQRGVDVPNQWCQMPARNVARKGQKYNRNESYPCLLTDIYSVMARIYVRDATSRTSTVDAKYLLDNQKGCWKACFGISTLGHTETA